MYRVGRVQDLCLTAQVFNVSVSPSHMVYDALSSLESLEHVVFLGGDPDLRSVWSY